jgi:hypothetical protein
LGSASLGAGFALWGEVLVLALATVLAAIMLADRCCDACGSHCKLELRHTRRLLANPVSSCQISMPSC